MDGMHLGSGLVGGALKSRALADGGHGVEGLETDKFEYNGEPEQRSDVDEDSDGIDGGAVEGDDSDWNSIDFSELSEDRRRKKTKMLERAAAARADPTRRSKRRRGGDDEVGDVADNIVVVRPSDGGIVAVDPSGGLAEDGAVETQSVPVALRGLTSSSLKNLTLQRDVDPKTVETEVAMVRSMWEMAAILDFLHMFRRDLKIERSFGAGELERVLVTSPGDGGLLADVHIDIMRGISPKNEVTLGNWQVTFANKVKFHWRALSDGSPCPFKPEKYLEALEYAELPTANRVRALHFLCCIRADREDIQARIAEAVREKLPEEVAAAEAAAEATRQRLARGTRSALTTAIDELPEVQHMLLTVDDFRRTPTGVDSDGVEYYYFDFVETTGFRLYTDAPFRSSEEAEAMTAAASSADLAELHQFGTDKDQKEAKMSKKRRERALRKMPVVKAASVVCDPPAPGKWELVASTFEELCAVGERLSARSFPVEANEGNDRPEDAALGALILNELAPQIQERMEAEERRQRAADRVRLRLGAPAASGGDGGGDGLGLGGRSLRERRPVNYAFPDYDNALRSAIRGQKPAGSDGEDALYGASRRMRRGMSPHLTGADATAVGLRRGRSAATMTADHEYYAMYDLNERALRQQARGSVDSGKETGDGEPSGVTSHLGAASGNGRVPNGMSRLARSSKDEDPDFNYPGGDIRAQVAKDQLPPRKRGRPRRKPILQDEISEPDEVAVKKEDPKARAHMIAEQQRLDRELMTQVAAKRAAEASHEKEVEGKGAEQLHAQQVRSEVPEAQWTQPQQPQQSHWAHAQHAVHAHHAQAQAILRQRQLIAQAQCIQAQRLLQEQQYQQQSSFAGGVHIPQHPSSHPPQAAVYQQPFVGMPIPGFASLPHPQAPPPGLPEGLAFPPSDSYLMHPGQQVEYPPPSYPGAPTDGAMATQGAYDLGSGLGSNPSLPGGMPSSSWGAPGPGQWT